MTVHESDKSAARFLTSQETIEMARIQKDPNVVAYALLTLDGEELESSGSWAGMIAPVFANAFDLADRIGDEVGEQDNHPMMHLESPDFEVAAVTLTSARAVIIKRKHKNPREGLRSVS